MEQSERADEEEYLEEGEEEVGGGGREEDEGEDSGDSTVEDGRAGLEQNSPNPGVPAKKGIFIYSEIIKNVSETLFLCYFKNFPI